MTIFDASNILFSFFLENQTLDLESDFSTLLTHSENVNKDKGIFLATLDEFEKLGYIKKCIYSGTNNNFWVLTKPFTYQEQKVSLSPETCEIISKYINEFGKLSENNSFHSEAANITADDIHKIILILKFFIEEKFNSVQGDTDTEEENE